MFGKKESERERQREEEQSTSVQERKYPLRAEANSREEKVKKERG